MKVTYDENKLKYLAIEIGHLSEYIDRIKPRYDTVYLQIICFRMKELINDPEFAQAQK